MYASARTVSIFVEILSKFLKTVHLLVSFVLPTRAHYTLLGFIKMLHSPVGSRESFEELLVLGAPNTEG